MQTKKLLTGLLFLSIILVLLAVFVKPKVDALIDEPLPPISAFSVPSEEVEDVIVSSSIMNSPRPIGDDQFWAAMYRQDPVTKKIYFISDREKEELQEMKDVDVATFRVRTTGDWDKYSFATDINGVYCNESIQPNIDLNSFSFVNNFSSYVKDAKNVYYSCDPIEGADPATLVEVGIQTPYAKDARYVYYKGERLPEADPKTFTLIGHGTDKYSMDAMRVYKEAALVGQRNHTLNRTSTGKLTQIYGTIIFEGQNSAHTVDAFKINRSEGSEWFMVHRGKIYFTNIQGDLVYYDPAISSYGTVNLGSLPMLDSRKLPAIVSYFFQGDDIYMLYGENCNEYLNRCSVRLIKHNTKTKQQDTIAEKLDARNITGFDETNGHLFISKTEGDGGCVWISTEKIDVATKTKVSSEAFNQCDGDVDYEVKWAKLKLFSKTVEGDITLADGVYFENGFIVPPLASTSRTLVKYFNN